MSELVMLPAITVTAILLFLSLLFWMIYLTKTLFDYKKLPKLQENKLDKNKESYPFISIVLPTRNESHRIKGCLESLKKQTYPNFEVIIVDDSEDNTVEIIKNIVGNDKRFKIIKENEKHDGWIGKPHALQQGSREAKGEWLLFIDADVSFNEKLVENAVQHAIKNSLDMLSVMMNVVCKTFWEKTVQPVPIGLLLFLVPLSRVNNPENKASFAAGPFILIKKRVFNKIGGYEQIKDKIADDVELAKLVKESGFKIGLAHAQHLIKLRMYRNLREIWEGWSKNIFMGSIQKRGVKSKTLQLLLALLGLFAVFDVMVLPAFTTIISLITNLLNPSPTWLHLLILAAFTWLLSLLVQFHVHKKYLIGDPRYTPLYFLGGIITMGLLVNSAIKTLTNSKVTWKGKGYLIKT
ncbi:MAG TPA: glycosyltransferase [Thermoplasmatales archaeon]|nr:glycosyltransferase [Thermoplasmatales archaeon]